jgi:nucleotide-binding universal stress UspA family protein
MSNSGISQKKILVAFDTCQDYQSILDFATTLAVLQRAQLSALFVEDINLFHLAGLPFTREIDRITSSTQPIDEFRITHNLHKQVVQIRHLLANVKIKSSLEVTLKVVRGHYVAEAIAAADEADLLLLDKRGNIQARMRSESRKKEFTPPVWIVFDGKQASERALDIAGKLTKDNRAELNIIVKADSRESAVAVEKLARQIVNDFHTRIHFFVAEKNDFSFILQCILQRGASIMIMSINRQEALISNQEASFFSEQANCPVLLVA